jgi:hypothetical protein
MKLLIGTLVFLILTLALVGYFMSISGKDQVYPPSVSDCPDHYTLSGSTCSAPIYLNVSDEPDISCNIQNFDQIKYKGEGTNFASGLCSKKLWANDCKVKWDGITNNDNICYA